jgi:hypothetical protein
MILSALFPLKERPRPIERTMNLQITAVIDPADRRQRMKNPAWRRPGAICQFQFPE